MKFSKLWLIAVLTALLMGLAACTGAATPLVQPTTAPVQPTATVPQPTATVPQPTATVAQPTATVAQPTATAKPTTPPAPQGSWVTSDIHNHTFLTDGSHVETEVVANAFDKFGLTFMANSEHGGASQRDPSGKVWDDASLAAKAKILGDPTKFADDKKAEHPAMWRWQSLTEFSWPILFGGKDGYGVQQAGLQSKYAKNFLIQGLEWNVPTHEHASVGIINQKDPTAIANFEYRFDGSDKDKSQASLQKANATHADAVSAAAYLEKNFATNSYMIINHPSRKQLFSVADIRDLNNAGPDVVLGLEGFPGHQKEAGRGGYNSNFYTDTAQKNLDEAKTARARTYGGADIMLAKVGGLMDALWGEGRRFWAFVNSDFHSSADDADFWPGEYAKTYSFAKTTDPQGFVDAMRSGNVFIVQGDLINALDFKAASGGSTGAMGQEVQAARGSDVTVTIRFKSPEKNNHGDPVSVDHIDLIAGDVTAKIDPADAKYKEETNPTTKVIATFTSKDWKKDADGYYTVTFTMPKVDRSQFLRLRGTNLGLGVENQTDKSGNPLNDDLMGKNDMAKAWADLWFYTNPIFVTVK